MWPDEGARSPWIFWVMRKQIETMLLRPKCIVLHSCLSSIACFLFHFPSSLSFKGWTAQVWVPEWYLWSYFFEYLFTFSPANIISANDNLSQSHGKQRALTFLPPCLSWGTENKFYIWMKRSLEQSRPRIQGSFLNYLFFFEDWGVVTLMEYFSGKHEDP